MQSLYAEAGEPSLRQRRLKLCMNYFLKLKSLPHNPCHNVINNPPPSELFERTKTIPPFGTRTLPHIEEANIEPNSIDSQYERTPPPWEHSNIMFDVELECILLSLKKFLTLPQFKNFIIYTYSLSAVESLPCKTFKAKNVKRFYKLLKKIPPQAQMVIAWIPSHVGISGNEKADRLAKAALTSSLAAHSQVCWSDLKPRVDTYICTAW